MTTVNLLDSATIKDGYRYSGTNTDGSPKEQPWAYNCIIIMKVSSNTEFTVIDPESKKLIKAVYYFNDDLFISSTSSVYGIYKFTTPSGCNNIRICPFATWDTFKTYNIRIEYEALLNDNTTDNIPKENSPNSDELQKTIDSLTTENKSLKLQITSLTTENSTLKNQIDILNSKISELEASTCSESDIEDLEIKINNLRHDMNILLNNM